MVTVDTGANWLKLSPNGFAGRILYPILEKSGIKFISLNADEMIKI